MPYINHITHTNYMYVCIIIYVTHIIYRTHIIYIIISLLFEAYKKYLLYFFFLYLNEINFRADKCSRFSRILLKFAKLNSREIFDNRRFARINLCENFGNGKFTKINSRKIFLKNFFFFAFFLPSFFRQQIQFKCVL